MSDTPLLEIRDLTKTFGSVQALTDVDFEVRAGEVMALVGDNGAGKSTLIKCIAGIHGHDSGEIFFDGEEVTSTARRTRPARDRGRLPGSRALRQPRRRPEHVPRPGDPGPPLPAQGAGHGAAHRGDAQGLRVTTIRSIRQTVATLSGGQRQSVAVARAVMWNSKLVILDEPTAALGVAQTEQVLELVRRLAEQGLAVILISHNLHDIFETATRITVLRLGRNVGVYERAATTQQEVVQAITAGIPTKVAGIADDRPGGRRVTTVDVAAPDLGPPGRRGAGESLAASSRQRPIRQSWRPPGRRGEVGIVVFFASPRRTSSRRRTSSTSSSRWPA